MVEKTAIADVGRIQKIVGTPLSGIVEFKEMTESERTTFAIETNNKSDRKGRERLDEKLELRKRKREPVALKRTRGLHEKKRIKKKEKKTRTKKKREENR